MASPFITPSINDGGIQVKQEPLDVEYTSPSGSVHTPQPPPSLPSPVMLPMLMKFTRHESPRSRTFDKPHNCCEVCQGEFNDQELLLQHKLLHFNTSHVCYICDCYFVNTSTLIMHIATNHRNLNPSMTGRNDPDRSFICSICLQRFSSNKTLQNHQEVHKQQGERSFCCKICGLDFIGYRALVPHLNSTRHKEMKIKIQSIFVCVDCRSVFPSRDSYAMHMMMRAQNESCVSRCGSDLASAQSSQQKVYNFMKTNGWKPNRRTERVQSSPQSQSDSRSDVGPLNLSIGSNLSPVQLYKGLTCVKCGETVPDEEALALHLMVHVRESTEKPYYSHSRNSTSFSRLTKIPSNESADVARKTDLTKRPDSAPVNENPKTLQGAVAQSTWTCHVCFKSFENCDFLALHMMDHHMMTNGVDHTNNNHTQDSKEEDTKSSKVVVQINETEKEMIPRVMPADQTSFSARSTPTGIKRSADLDDEDDPNRPKRCKSMDSSIFPCLFCEKHFIGSNSRDSHIVNDHGASMKSPHCLVCSIPFIQLEALKEHLETDAHREMMKVQKTACQVCDFIASSSSQIREHESLHGIISHKGSTVEPLENGSLIAQLLKDRMNPEDPDQQKTEPTSESAAKADVETKNGDANGVLHPDEKKDVDETGNQATTSRRSKRKPRISAKFIPGLTSPSHSENDSWMDETNLPALHALSMSPRQLQQSLLPMPVSMDPSMMVPNINTTASILSGIHARRMKARTFPEQQDTTFQRPATATNEANPQTANHDDGSDIDLIDYVLSNSEKLTMCKYCKIIFTDQTMFYLHMGLHNLNDPWQCNLCGKANRNVHEFTSHVIHY